jgi:transposase InsO family protein
MLGRMIGNRNSQADTGTGQRTVHGNPLHGHHFLHTAIDAYSRLAYSRRWPVAKSLPRSPCVHRPIVLFAERGIRVRKVLTDNGSCYRSQIFREALSRVEHRRTRPKPTAKW